jgi:UDP-2,4-diacetamido-2,4,6-trideoxy-beta-L-altropyranose hydrolase
MQQASTTSPGGCLRKIDKNVAFRVDASYRIGTGHFMRCLTLADGLRRAGAITRFVCRHLPEHLCAKLTESGHEFACLAPEPEPGQIDELAHAAWLGVDQRQDASATLHALSDRRWDWLVVDHYALDRRWEAFIRQVAEHILAIDDIADRQHDCDVLLDQNLHADMETRYSSKVPLHCRLLLGPHYALLREEFRTLRGQVQLRNGPVWRILVFFGGIDAGNFTGRTVRALSEIELGNIHVDVVVGAKHPFRAEMAAACAQHGFEFHVQTERMADLMAVTDLAIGAGGSASWERCALGLPAILIALADNQINIAIALDNRGAAVYLGTADQVGIETLREAVADLLTNQNRFHELSKRAYSMADGLGVDRVMATLVDEI